MKKFKFLIKNSLIRKIKSKAFIISTAITSALIFIIALLPAIITMFSEEESLPVYEVLLVNETSNTDIKSYLENNSSLYFDLNIEEKSSVDATTLTNFYNDDTYDLILVYQGLELIDVEKVDIYSKLGMESNNILNSIVTITKFELLEVEDYYITVNPILNPEDNDNGQRQMTLLTVAPFIFMVIFMFIVFATQTLGAEILEEKSTKAIETIISSVPTNQHFFSKIISSSVFTAIQLGIMVVTGLLGLLVSSLLLSSSSISLSQMIQSLGLDYINWPMFLIFMITSLILGLVLYLVYFAYFASFANNNEEYQKTQSPLMIVLVIVFYGTLVLTMADQITILNILGFIPFFTPFILPVLILSGEMTWLIAVLQTVILLGFIFISTRFILPLYRSSILDYSGDGLIKRIKRSYQSRKTI